MWIPIDYSRTVNTYQNIQYIKNEKTVDKLNENKTKFNNLFNSKCIYSNFNKNLKQYNYLTTLVPVKTKIEIKYDFKTNTFRVLINANNWDKNKALHRSILKVSIQINNNNDYKNETSNLVERKGLKDWEILNSFSFNKKLLLTDINSISIKTSYKACDWPTIPLVYQTEEFALVKNDKYTDIKKDYLINENNKEYFDYVVSDSIDSNNESESTYKTIVFKPIELKQNENTIKFISITSPNEPFSRPKIDLHKIHNIPFSKTDNKDLDVSLRDDGAIYDINTFYDFKQNKIIEGFGENSYPGYFIPYNFFGRIYPYIDLDINGIKGIKISWSQNIEKPYFDSKQGLIKLNIKTNNDVIDNEKQRWCNIPINYFDLNENKNITFNEILEKLEKVKINNVPQ